MKSLLLTIMVSMIGSAFAESSYKGKSSDDSNCKITVFGFERNEEGKLSVDIKIPGHKRTILTERKFSHEKTENEVFLGFVNFLDVPPPRPTIEKLVVRWDVNRNVPTASTYISLKGWRRYVPPFGKFADCTVTGESEYPVFLYY